MSLSSSNLRSLLYFQAKVLSFAVVFQELCDRIQAELFKTLKEDSVKVCTQYVSKFGRFSSGHSTAKGHFITVSKKDNAKEGSNYHTIALISHASKVMLKILQVSLQQYVN